MVKGRERNRASNTSVAAAIFLGCVGLGFSSLCSQALAADSAVDEMPITPRSLAKIEKLIVSEWQQDRRGGVTAGIIENGELVWQFHHGFADEASKSKIAGNSIYPVGSLTKMVTGIMLLQLMEAGKIHLTDPVSMYVPEIRNISNRYPWAPPVTLIQLATMTAGLDSACCSREWEDGFLPSDTWDARVISALGHLSYAYEPGTRRKYSNWGYAILGVALGRAAHRPFPEYVQAEILAPLGMSDTTFALMPGAADRVVRGYVPGRTEASGIRAENSIQDFSLPAGGLLSTLDDLAKLMRFQLGSGPDTVISRDTLRASYQMVVPSDADLRYGDGVGFAAVRNADGQLTALGHGGLLNGFAASYEFDLATQTGIILLTNTSYGRADYKKLARRILALLHPSSSGGSGVSPTENH